MPNPKPPHPPEFRLRHVEQVASGGNVIDFGNDDSGQLSMLARAVAESSTELAYDGRGFLRLATKTIPNPDAGTASGLAPVRRAGLLRPRGTPGTPIFADGFESGDVCEWSSFVGIPDPGCPPDFLISTATATYSSAGALHVLERDSAPTARHVFYFGGRPVALRDLTGTTETWRWVTTDHLGTPIATTGTTGALQWSGGFEPFGRDFTTPSAQDSGVFLRFPGQWFDEAWEESSLGAEVYYNVHRWAEPQTGRYTRPDPLGLLDGGLHPYAYALPSPVLATDPLGLAAKVCCRLLNSIVVGTLARLRHCYVKADDGTVYGLYPEDRNGKQVGVPRTNDPLDKGGRCQDCECVPSGAGGQNECLRDAHNNYPVGEYKILGPNSNTYAGTLARKCCKGGIPFGLGSAPAIDSAPPKPAPPPQQP